MSQPTRHHNLPLTPPSYRLNQVNANIKQIFGEILQRKADLPANAMVTVSAVDTTHNLRSTTVWLSVLPAKQATATMRKLRPQMYRLQGLLNQALNMRPLPKINLKIDHDTQPPGTIKYKLADLNHQ